MKLEYSVPKAPVSYIKTLLPVLATIFGIQLSERLAGILPPLIRLPFVMLLALSLLALTYRVVYYQMAHYHYAWIDGHWVFERVVGRSNHAVIVVKPEDFVAYGPYNGDRVPRRDFFVGSVKDPANRMLTFKQGTRMRSIVVMLPPEMVSELEAQLAHVKVKG